MPATAGWRVLTVACLVLVVVSVAVPSATRAVRLHCRCSPAQRRSALAVAARRLVRGRAGPARLGGAGGHAEVPPQVVGAVDGVAAAAGVGAVVKPVTRFSGRLVGHMSSSGPDQYGDAAVAIAMAVRGSTPGLVKLTLWGTAIEDGGIQMSRSEVSFEDARTGTVYTGTVVGLEGNLVVADVTSPGSTLRLTMRLRIDA